LEGGVDTRVLTTHVPNLLAQRVDGFAARMGRSRSWIIIQALTEWVARQDAGLSGSGAGFSETQAGFEAEMMTPARAAASLKSLRENSTLSDVSWQELRDTGRR